MDVVVRTPHGSADVDLVAAPPSATLADLLEAVTGQAAPATARVDGRTVSTSHEVAELDLAIGSVIDTHPASATAHRADEPHIVLLQVTGRGAGTEIPLTAGRYRVGAGRRVRASEMDWAPVETSGFEIDVDDQARVNVTAGRAHLGAHDRPRIGSLTLDGAIVERRTAWTSGRLSVGGRMFEIDRPTTAPSRRRLAAPDRDGTIGFRRAARPVAADRPLVVGALRDAATLGDALWRRRRGDHDAFVVPIGLDASASGAVSIDLGRHRGVAMIGSDRFAAGVARTVLVEAVTRTGPADLRVVIATSLDRAPRWSWARWLPHIRGGGPGSPADVFTDVSTLSTWASSVRPSSPLHRSGHPAGEPSASAVTGAARDPAWRPPDADPGTRPLTVLVTDDVSLWSRRQSPLRPLLTDPPPELRIIAICDHADDAPSMCTTLVQEVTPEAYVARDPEDVSIHRRRPLLGSLAELHVRTDGGSHVEVDVHPAMTERRLAEEVARAMAPLDDLEADRHGSPPSRLAAPSLAELIASPPGSDAVAPHPDRLEVAIGMSPAPNGSASATSPRPAARAPARIDLATGEPTVLAIHGAVRHDATVAACVIGAAARRPPDQLAVLVVGRRRAPWLDEIPHLAGWVDRGARHDPARLVHRVAHVLGEVPGLEVLVIVEEAFTDGSVSWDDHAGVAAGFIELASSVAGVHLVLTTTDAPSVPTDLARRGTSVHVSARGSGTVHRGDRATHFVAVDTAPTGRPAPAAEPERIEVRPAAHLRPMTPLERRLARFHDERGDGGDGLGIAAIARDAIPSASRRRLAPSVDLVPPALPGEIDRRALSREHPGDGIPLGVLDRPETASFDVYWWQPRTHGTLTAIGSPRSGVTSLVDLLLTGIAGRTSADDLHLYVVEALPQRRRAASSLPHTGGCVTPDDGDATAAMIDAVHSMLVERLEGPGDGGDQPDVLLLIDDVQRLRRSLDAVDAARVLDRLVEIGTVGAGVGIDLVLVAHRHVDLGALVSISGDRLVGTLTDPSDRERLGAPAAGLDDRRPGRLWSTGSARRVQLAEPPLSVEREIVEIAPERATVRPPRPTGIGSTS
ncbi:hypothetical protein [Ilumatobacter sp.]|uniref:hypothetical protein n=1 Tax=Ilumatobacter sp. TaxID=1967498 RepID=UPI003B519B44